MVEVTVLPSTSVSTPVSTWYVLLHRTRAATAVRFTFLRIIRSGPTPRTASILIRTRATSDANLSNLQRLVNCMCSFNLQPLFPRYRWSVPVLPLPVVTAGPFTFRRIIRSGPMPRTASILIRTRATSFASQNCPDTGKLHVEFYIELKSPKALSAAKAI